MSIYVSKLPYCFAEGVGPFFTNTLISNTFEFPKVAENSDGIPQVPSASTQPCTLVPKRGHEPVWRHWNLSFWKDRGPFWEGFWGIF